VAGTEHAAPRPAWSWERARTSVAAVPAVAWLVGLVAASTVLRFVFARVIPAPFIFQDELLYSELAKSFGSTGHFAVRGLAGNAGVGPVYPLVISPAYALFGSVPHAYVAVKAINALLVSFSAVPVYLLARRLLAPLPSLLAAVLTLTLPWLFFSALVMTENAFFPIFLFWFWSLVVMLERPTLVRQLVLFALLALAYETRPQAVALLPALVTALALVIVGEAWFGVEQPRWRAALRSAVAFWPTWLVLALGTVLFAGVELVVRGQSLSQSLLHAYARLGDVHYSVGSVLRWTLWHVAELDIVVGVIPFAALLAVLLAAFARLTTSPALRAFAAAAFGSCLWLLVEVGAFASSPYSHRIQDRPLFYVVPVFLVALMVWAFSDVGRAWPLAGFAALIAAALPGTAPVASFLGVNTINDAFGLLDVWVLRDKVTSVEGTMAAVMLAAMAAGAIFLLFPRRWAAVPVFLVFAFFAYGNHSVDFFLNNASHDAIKFGISGRKDWIDHAVGRNADVAAIFTGNRDYVTLWENEFFNRSLGNVYNLSGPPDALPELTVSPSQATGGLFVSGVTPIRVRYALADSSLLVAGRVIARDKPLGMVLYRTDGSLRLAARLTGIYADRWSSSSATYVAYACHGRRLRVVLAGEPRLRQGPVTVIASSGGRRLAKLVVPPSLASHPYTIPLISSGGACQVDFAVSPTAVPADTIGGQDTRPLGIRFMRFTVKP
jgi:hypothetical protein